MLAFGAAAWYTGGSRRCRREYRRALPPDVMGRIPMSDLLLGLGVVFLDFSVYFGDHSVGLIPDVAGYLFLLSGFKKIRGKSPVFDMGEKLLKALLLLSAFIYVEDLLALMKDFPTLDWMLDILSEAGGLAIAFLLVRGLRDVETGAGEDFQVRHLMTMWLATAVLQGLAMVFKPVPLLNLVCIFASIVVIIVFLVAFHKTEKLAKPYLY